MRSKLISALLITAGIFYSVPLQAGYQEAIDAKNVTVDTSNFTTNLDSTDTDVQKALETIDQMAGGGSGITGIAGSSGGTATGPTVTLTGSGTVTTSRSGNSITITGSAGGTPSCPSVIKSADYTLIGSDCTVIFDTSGGAKVATLPTAVGFASFYNVKRSGASNLTIGTTGGETIDGDSTEVLIVDNTSLQLVADGSNWRIV